MDYIKPALADKVKSVRLRIGDSCNDLSDDEVYEMLNENAYIENEQPHYDIWATASDCLLLLASKYKLQFTFSSNNQKFELNQKINNCIALSKEYSKKARVTNIEIVNKQYWF